MRPVTPWASVVSGYPAPLPPKRVTIHCRRCGFAHYLSRGFAEPQEIHIVCHGCELPMVSTLTPDDMARDRDAAVA